MPGRPSRSKAARAVAASLFPVVDWPQRTRHSDAMLAEISLGDWDALGGESIEVKAGCTKCSVKVQPAGIAPVNDGHPNVARRHAVFLCSCFDVVVITTPGPCEADRIASRPPILSAMLAGAFQKKGNDVIACTSHIEGTGEGTVYAGDDAHAELRSEPNQSWHLRFQLVWDDLARLYRLLTASDTGLSSKSLPLRRRCCRIVQIPPSPHFGIRLMLAEFGLLPINVLTLVPTTALGMDLYQFSEVAQRPVLFLGGDYPLEQTDLERVRERGAALYISIEQQEAYQAYLRELAMGDGETASGAVRVGVLNEVVRDALRKAFLQEDINQTVAIAHELSELTGGVVCDENFDTCDLFQVLHHDYTTFTHSANVAWYAAILAKALGYSKSEIVKITTGGLLHDLGKLEIPKAILCKPGRLDEYEFRVIKTHPTLGFRKLFHRLDLDHGQLMMAYQHHERLDGLGYPVGQPSEEIHPWAKLCSVVDVFEAVTSYRPYRKPMLPRQAIALIEREAGTALDREIVQCWNATIRSGSISS